MALKLVVSVVSTVVGARLEALDRFFGLRTTWAGLLWSDAGLGVFVALALVLVLLFSATPGFMDIAGDGLVVVVVVANEPKKDGIFEEDEIMSGF